jgi:hypothetical protein
VSHFEDAQLKKILLNIVKYKDEIHLDRQVHFLYTRPPNYLLGLIIDASREKIKASRKDSFKEIYRRPPRSGA